MRDPGGFRARPRFSGRSHLFCASLALCLSLGLTGCADLLNTLFDNPAPTGLSASDGDYPDRIDVSWGKPSLTSEKWTGYVVDYFDISYSGAVSGSDKVFGTSYSIPIAMQNRASEVSVTVTAHLRNGLITAVGGTASDTGFALDTEELIWNDGGRDYLFSGADRWYVTMLQKGFNYNFSFSAGGPSRIEFYDYKTLGPLRGSTVTGSSVSWRCDSTGASNKFYVRVVPTLPYSVFSATFGF